ncbi:MAG: rhodanese-like domain-containing protein [Pontiella sp.]
MKFRSKSSSEETSKTDLPQRIQDGALLIDARSPMEFSGGHIDGAINLPHDIIGQEIKTHAAAKNRSMVVYCQSGGRSQMAVKTLHDAGYTQVENGGAIDLLRQQIGTSS